MLSRTKNHSTFVALHMLILKTLLQNNPHMGTVHDRASRAQNTCGPLYNSLRCWMEEFATRKEKREKAVSLQ